MDTKFIDKLVDEIDTLIYDSLNDVNIDSFNIMVNTYNGWMHYSSLDDDIKANLNPLSVLIISDSHHSQIEDFSWNRYDTFSEYKYNTYLSYYQRKILNKISV